MFEKNTISQSMIDAVNNVLENSNSVLTEKVDVKKRTTDTLAGRVKIPPSSGDNEHTAFKVELNSEEREPEEDYRSRTAKDEKAAPSEESPEERMERKRKAKEYAKESYGLDEVLDTSSKRSEYLEKSAKKRAELTPQASLDKPDIMRKIRKSFAGSHKVLDKSSVSEEVLDERDEGKPGKMFKVIAAKAAEKYGSKEAGARVAGAIRKKVLAKESVELDEENKLDVISMDVPLLIRLMEYAKEDAKSDMDLHKVAERLTSLSASGDTLSMEDYDQIVSSIKEAVGGFGSSYSKSEKEAEIGHDHDGEKEQSPTKKTYNNYGKEVRTPKMVGMHFYNVPKEKEADAKNWGLKQTKAGKWQKTKYDTSGASHEDDIRRTDMKFGKSTYWEPKKLKVEGKRPEDDSVPFVTNEVAPTTVGRLKKQLVKNPLDCE